MENFNFKNGENPLSNHENKNLWNNENSTLDRENSIFTPRKIFIKFFKTSSHHKKKIIFRNNVTLEKKKTCALRSSIHKKIFQVIPSYRSADPPPFKKNQPYILQGVYTIWILKFKEI